MIDWNEISERDGPAAWRTAWRVLGNRADADEVYQETFLAAFAYSQQHTVVHWRALLQRLATARAIDRLRIRVRRRGREERLADASPLDASLQASGPMPLQQSQHAELSERLRLALATINPKHAQVFCLFHLDGWSYTEIAGHLAISTDVVGAWLHRARGRLRELLKETNEVLS